jgi:outer membrane protein TolC
VRHNLDIQIAHYEVEINRFNLSGAYGAYEPWLNVSGAYSYAASPGGFNAQNQPFPENTSKNDFYQANITQLLPTGLSFNLAGNLDNTTGFNSSGPFANGSGAASISMRQPLLKNFWTDASRMTIAVNKKELTISELALRQQIMTTVSGTALAYYNVVLATKVVEIQKRARDQAKQLVNDSKKRVDAGALARQDEKQAESQLLARESDVLGAEGTLVNQEYTLKSLLSDDFGKWGAQSIEATTAPGAESRTFDLAESWRKGLSRRPDILQAKTDLERQGIVLKFLNNQRFPELDLTGSYGQAGSGTGLTDALQGIQSGNSPFYSFGAQLTVPLFGNRAARANYRAGKAVLDQLLLRFKQLEQNVMVQIGTAVESAQTRLGQVEKTRQSREFAESALEAEQKKLENGKSTEFVVIQLQRDLTSARLAEISSLIQYDEALVALALQEGTILDQNNLELDVK